MRWLIIMTLLAFGLVAHAQADQVVSQTEAIDPVTGNKIVKTTTSTRIAYSDLLPRTVVVGAPVVTRTVTEPLVISAFPDSPYDGQRVVMNGKIYEWDAGDGEWEADDDDDD
jgi:hypothetical protein